MHRMLLCRILAGLLCIAVWGTPGLAAPRTKPILDPRDAGPDFQIQGEYEGELASGDRYGVQVVALGNDAYRAVGYEGGLPGQDQHGKPHKRTEAVGSGGKVSFESELGRGEIDLAQGQFITLYDPTGAEQGRLARVERQSPTLGMPPAEGALVLFDGKGGDREAVRHWRSARSKNGLLQVGAQTIDNFEDCFLHVEFQTPYLPKERGQDRGNSGVYLQRHYEIQILDSFGLDGDDNECGAIYRFRRPDVNMCLPPLAWQTYDIDFRSARYDESGQKTAHARVTVRHNGVMIHDDVELSPRDAKPWRGEETPGGGPLLLQFHGSPVQFRNIWIVPRPATDE